MGEESIDKSGYNEAAFKMARINDCQRRINFVNSNLLAFYYEFGAYGYAVKRTELLNLISEVWGKLDSAKNGNRDKCKEYTKMMDDMLEYKPIHTQRRINDVGGSKKTSKVNTENFKNISKLLFVIHMYINELLEAAGYSTFTIEADDANDPYN